MVLLIFITMKKFFLFLVFLISFLAIQNVFAQYSPSFSDVNGETVYSDSINWMASNGVIQGYSDGTFKPDQCVNRAEFLKMMYLTLGTDIITSDSTAGSHYYDDYFTDTIFDSWYWPYVNEALRNETIEGYADRTFKPEQCVNRAEAIKMATLGFDLLVPMEDLQAEYNNLTGFWDVPEDAWYFQVLYSANDRNAFGRDHIESGMLESGDAIEYFWPGADMSRQEVAEMLYRMKTIQDNEAETYTDALVPDPLNFYVSENSGVSFIMPEGWHVIQDNYYTTAAGVVAEYPTISINPEEETEHGENTVSINQRMMQCGGEFGATCFDINEHYSIGAFDPSMEAMYLINRILLTFREGTLAYKTYNNEDFNLSFNYPSNWSVTQEAVYDLGNFDQLQLDLTFNDNSDIAMSINTPPIETGYENMTIADGFSKEIEGLTESSNTLFRNPETDWHMARNDYYIEDTEWTTHIEFFLSGPGDVFYNYLNDYLEILDSVNFNPAT